MNKYDKETATLQNAQASARTTEQAVTTYRNALDATGVNLLGWLEDYLTDEDAQDEYYRLLDELAESYDLIDEDGELIDFYSAYVTDATAEQAETLRNDYDTIYIAYSNELEMYVLITDWYGLSMEQVQVIEYTENSTQVA